MRRILFALLLVTAPVLARRPATPAVAMLDQILHDPGAWDQMCSGPDPKPINWLPLYGFRRNWNWFYISEENFERLRQHREAVVQELNLRILASMAAAVQRAESARRGEQSGWRGSPLETYLAIVEDLNGVENLPALLHLEEALNRVPLYGLSSRSAEAFEHPQVLSVITLILHNEGAPGLNRLHGPGLYNADFRRLIVELAHQFLEKVDPSEYRAGAAMSKVGKYR